MTTLDLLLLLLTAASTAAALFLAVRMGRDKDRNQSLHSALNALRDEHATLRAELNRATDGHAAMTDLFRAASRDATQEALAILSRQTAEITTQREALAVERVAAQLRPVADTLGRFEQQVSAMERARAADQGGLKAQIESLMRASMDTQSEARRLAVALRTGGAVRGGWGRDTLRNVLDYAGLQDQFDFCDQSGDVQTDIPRPDVCVRLPGGGEFVIDAKCSVEAFFEAQDATDDATRTTALEKHAAAIRAHMLVLATPTYWQQFTTAGGPDFVAMFVPADGVLAAALDVAPDLMTTAMQHRVLIVSPTTLFGLCKAVVYGWRVEEQARNTQQVAKVAREIYRGLSTVGGHIDELGKALAKATTKYNVFVASMETEVLREARRLDDLALDHGRKEISPPSPVKSAVRSLVDIAPDGEEASSPTASVETGAAKAVSANGRRRSLNGHGASQP